MRRSGLAVFGSLFFREAVRALARHKLRSALTALGITIGIAAVVLVVAIGRASSARVDLEFQKLGDNLVWLEAGSRNVHGVRTGSHGTSSLTIEDAQAVLAEIPLIRRMSPQVDGSVQIVRSGHNWYTRFRGEGPAYVQIKRWDVARGTMFTDDDVEQGARKLLLGHTVATELFGDADPIGDSVRIKGQPFEVIGLLGAKGQSGSGQDQDDFVLMPYTTAERALRGGGYTWLDDVLCSAVSADAVLPAIEQVTALMRQRHHIRPGDDDDFNIRRPDELLRAQRESGDTLSALLLSVAAVSLLIGGIGIMNVMLASVAQRTREIGLRMAVGATGTHVQLQFIGEATLLSLVGGLAGVALSGAGALVFASATGGPIAIPAQAVLLALGSSVCVGVFFGFYPARRAARLDPIEALRTE